MKIFRRAILLLFILVSFGVNAQGTIKTMVYNILDFPSAWPNNRAQILRDILNEYQPDIFMVCELQSEYGANLILDISLNSTGNNYRMAPFEPSQSGDPDHQQLVFYRKGIFTLENWEVIPTSVRDINYYQLKLSTADQETDPVYFEIFVTHLKSSPGTANKQLRLEMVQHFTSKLQTMDPHSYVLFAGDLNLYTHTEPAYQELFNVSNNIVMADPLDRPGSWHDNPEFQDIHSQSTRISSGPFGAGAGGGLDDRFDFILISQNMLSDPKLKYIPETYKSFGNNGNCFDNSINSPDCDGDFGQTLRNNLYNMSDHLPIVMDVETNKEIVLSGEDFALDKSIILESTIVVEKLNFRLGSNVSEKITFQIYNTIGQRLMEQNSENHQYFSIDISQLSNGIYYIKSNLPNAPAIKFLKTTW
ncbi:T9SS type A sorting domain-containing protein [Aequorivita sp. H23M31]|uniref:T9SS type A sorting domain-containing protein n=1 Tax=Aequorivita ciconiae TaxID=2494375 RepID=A0A410G2E7_9FLAO|nr:T9SS type A sorting domain-containing protein [Aequorivita sp. H23M31]QAA81436.1 T9SS type A sorting domain-containing protein [Aequorivita sp. H23M31]